MSISIIRALPADAETLVRVQVAAFHYDSVLYPGVELGGPPGYELYLRILGDREHEQHEDMVRWIGGVFDPKGFDLNRLNREFKGAKKRRR